MIKTIPTLCGSVAGQPSGLGVALHNAGYRENGLNYTYIAMGSDDLDSALTLATIARFRGLAVSMPHKTAVIERLDTVTADVSAIGACNTVVFDEDQKKTGYNTDWTGARDAMLEAGINKPKKAVIVGAGGAARAIAYALRKDGCAVYISARNAQQATDLVDSLGLAGKLSIEEQATIDADLLVNATPDATLTGPLDLVRHTHASALFDVVFNELTTPLIKAASEAGLTTVPGWRMLLHQALEQFRLYTKTEPPAEVMSAVLEKAFSKEQ